MKKKLIFSSLLCILFILLVNTSSFATFKITNFLIDSELSDDGDLYVAETIVYYTDEVVNGLTRKVITKNPRNPINSADSFGLYSVQVENKYCEQVSSAENGDDRVYEYTLKGDNEYNIKLYSPFKTGYKTIKYNYVLDNVAVKYNDVGELFWNFIGEEWDCEIKDLTIRITLPDTAENEKIYVFGHGSDNGTFTKEGNFIQLKAYDLEAYQPLDARILFSKNAISDSKKVVDKDVLEKYINMEEGLSEKIDSTRIIGNFSFEGIVGVLSIIVIIIGIVSYLLFDKEVRVGKQKYVREVPYGLSPEILQYIYYGKIKPDSFYVAVLNLVKLGVYRIENIINEVGKQTQKIIYNANHTATLKKYQEDIVKTINVFLEEKFNGEKSLDLMKLAIKMENSTGSGMKKYQDNLKAEKESLLGKPTKTPKTVITFLGVCMVLLIITLSVLAYLVSGEIELMFVMIILFFIVTVVYSYVFASIAGGIVIYAFVIVHSVCFQGLMIGMLVSLDIGIAYIPYILMFIIIQYVLKMKKYSIEERQLFESISGLKRYIKDYSLLHEKDSLDYIELWEDYFIMAIALGLNNKTINYFYNYGREQNTNMSLSMRETNTFLDFHDNMYYPFYNYQRSSNISRSSNRSSYSGSSGGFSGGSSSGGGGGRRWRRRTFLKYKK